MTNIDPRLIFRTHYEEPWRNLPLRGWRLRRHCLAIRMERFACWVRGRHMMAWEPDWKDWFCTSCHQLFEDREPPWLDDDADIANAMTLYIAERAAKRESK